MGASGWEKDVEDLVAKQRPEDCHPALTAASVTASKGMVSLANSYFDSVTATSDLAFYSRVNAEVMIANGKTEKAVHALVASLRSNPLDVEVYRLLQRIDPTVNWMAVSAVERMVARLPYDQPPSEPVGKETVIYGICNEWYNGDHDTATRMLISSDGYRSTPPDLEFLLLSARMSRDSGDVAAARSVYSTVINGVKNGSGDVECIKDDIGVLCEAAEVFLEGDGSDPRAAHDLYRQAEAIDPGNFKVIRGLIRTYSALGMDAEAAGVLRDFLGTESADKGDYLHAAGLFMDMGCLDDAEDVCSALVLSYPGDSDVQVLASRVAAADGDLNTALDCARKAVRCDRTSADAYAQLSHVMLLLRQVSSAVRKARKAVACDARSVPALTAVMDACRETGDTDGALEYCNRILDIDSSDEHARDVLAHLSVDLAVRGESSASLKTESASEFVYLLKGLVEEKRFTEVERLCAENSERYGDNVDVLRLKGNAEYANHEYVKASASFARAVTIRPSAVLWHSKGLADEGFGDLQSALDAYDRAILLDMKNPHYWTSRGCVLEMQHDYPSAVEAFNRAIELDQTAPFPLVHKAVIFSRVGRTSEALAYMDMAANADHENPGIRRIRMKMCLDVGRYSEAADICRNLLTGGKDLEVTAGLVRAEMGLGDMSSARDILTAALNEDPRDLGLLLVARDYYIKGADLQAFVGVCHTIMTVNPFDRETRLMLADTLMKEGRTEEANQIYNTVGSSPSESVPEEGLGDPASLLSIARSMLKAGALDGAARNADKLLEMDPDNEDYVIFRSQVYVGAGQTRDADFVLREYLRRDPDSIRVLEEYGDLKERMHEHQEAADLYTRCLSLVNATGNMDYRARLLVKLAKAQDAMKARPAAIRSYTEAVSLKPDDCESARALARMLLVSGDRDAALNVIHTSLKVEESSQSFAVLIQVYQAFGDVEGVRDAYRGFIRFDNPSQEDVLTVVSALNSVGLVSEAEMLRGRSDSVRRISAEVSTDVPPSVKRCAERLMRRAYMQGIPIDDPSVRDVMDVDSELAVKALDYLGDVPVYGDVIPGTPDYERMETLSYNVAAAPKGHGMDNVSVAAAYVAGHARDADEAKVLVAYIAAAKVSAIPSDVPQEIRRLALAYGTDVTLEQIMLDNRCGVMTARIIQSCI